MSSNDDNTPVERFTYYEKFHLHDHVYSKNEIDNDLYDKTDIDTELATKSDKSDVMLLDGSQKMTADMDINSNSITNVKDPVNDNDVCNKVYVDGLIPKVIFYRGKCHHNNEKDVKFYSNGTFQHATNVKQSHNDDFVSSSGSKTKLLIKNKGMYILSLWDGIKTSSTGFIHLKMDKASINLAGGVMKFPVPDSNNGWQSYQLTTVLEVAENTNLEMKLTTGILDGLSYSWLTIYRLTE